jgi:hypothetical protein
MATTKNDEIRTLGLYQPFASLMLHGKIETRMVRCEWDSATQSIIDRKPPFPLGTYLIYSTKKEYFRDEVKRITGRFFEGAMISLSDEPTFNTDKRNGHAICIGNLVEIIDPIQCEFHPATFVDLPVYDVDIHNYPISRRVGLRFEAVKRIKPFPITGKQGVGFLSVADHLKIEFL